MLRGIGDRARMTPVSLRDGTGGSKYFKIQTGQRRAPGEGVANPSDTIGAHQFDIVVDRNHDRSMRRAQSYVASFASAVIWSGNVSDFGKALLKPASQFGVGSVVHHQNLLNSALLRGGGDQRLF